MLRCFSESLRKPLVRKSPSLCSYEESPNSSRLSAVPPCSSAERPRPSKGTGSPIGDTSGLLSMLDCVSPRLGVCEDTAELSMLGRGLAKEGKYDFGCFLLHPALRPSQSRMDLIFHFRK